MKLAILLCASALLATCFISCEKDPDNSDREVNAPAPGFDLADSDPAAVELADSIMVAMGGRKNWDQTRYISWNFFRKAQPYLGQVRRKRTHRINSRQHDLFG